MAKYFSVLKEKNDHFFKIIILELAKLAFRNEGKIMAFPQIKENSKNLSLADPPLKSG